MSDREHPFETHNIPQPKSFWSEDILYWGKEYLRSYAVSEGYNALIWQGSDCYYSSKWDFSRYIRRARRWEINVVGALTSARTDSMFPIARRFTGSGTKQENISNYELRSGNIISCYGFPGADALFIKQPFLNESLHQFENFKPWYEIREENPDSLCIEEFWIWKMGKKYPNSIWLDTAIRTWHVHEDGIARRWKGEERRIEELNW